MRLLSDKELDEVLGGADRASAITLPAVTANASVASNPSIVFSLSNRLGYQEVMGPDATGNSPCYAAYYHALNTLPTFARIRCLTTHTEYPGRGVPATTDIVLVNAFTYGPPGTSGSIDYAHLTATSSPSYPAGNLLMSGVWQSTTNYNTITITANGMSAQTAPFTYKDVASGAILTWNQGLSAGQHLAFVLGHEGAHISHITDEQAADGYGMYAVFQYDNLPAGTCPAN